jgi:hypothetical protein
MSEFVFLYRGGERPDSPDLIQQMIQKWMTWLKDLGAKGHLKDTGQPLELTGKLVRGRQKKRHRRPLCGDQGYRRRLLRCPGQGYCRGSGVFSGLPDFRHGRHSGSATRHENVTEPSDHFSSVRRGAAATRDCARALPDDAFACAQSDGAAIPRAAHDVV